MDLKEFARQESIRQGVDPGLILPLIGTESGWRTGAVSPKGAAGLMQLMPATARGLGLSDADRHDPAKAIPAGIRYYKQQLDRFGSPELAYAAYNAGPGAVQKHGGVPPYRETQNYVRKNMGQPKTMSDADLLAIYGGKSQASSGARTMSDDDLLAIYGGKPKPAKINHLEGYNAVERGLIGAGKAATDFLHGVGLGNVLGLSKGDEEADRQLMSDGAGMVGNIAGQAGLMYVGGRAVQGVGSVLGSVAQGVSAAGGAAPKLARVASVVQKAGRGFYAPETFKGAAASGAAFGLVSKDGSFGDRFENALAGGAGGAAGLGAGKLLGSVIGKGAQVFRGALTPKAEARATAAASLRMAGVDLNALPRNLQAELVKQAKRGADLSGLDPASLTRAGDFEQLGIEPLRGWLTRNPKDWWMANSLNTVDDTISGRFRDANAKLLETVNAGTEGATDFKVGNAAQDVIAAHDAALKRAADALYDQARGMHGRDIALDPNRFVDQASRELDDKMLGSKLPSDVLSWFKKAISGAEPFTMDVAQQRLQALNQRIYSTHDPAEKLALGTVKSHLINAIDGAGVAASGEQQALAGAFGEARKAAATRFKFQDAPLVDGVLSGKLPAEKIPAAVSRMSVDDLGKLSAMSREHGIPLMDRLADAVRVELRDSATLQAETGGAFTVAGLRRAMDKIGPEKGRMLLGDDWLRYERVLRAAGAIHNPAERVAGSPTFQNAARLMSLTRIPGVSPVVDIALKAGSMAKQASDVGKAIRPDYGLLMPDAPPARALPYLPLLGVAGAETAHARER